MVSVWYTQISMAFISLYNKGIQALDSRLDKWALFLLYLFLVGIYDKMKPILHLMKC